MQHSVQDKGTAGALNRRTFCTMVGGAMLATQGCRTAETSDSGAGAQRAGTSFAVIEAPSVLGLFPRGVETLPRALLGAGFLQRLHARVAEHVTPPAYQTAIDPATHVLNAGGIAAYTPQLADAVARVLNAKEFPLVLGGDCSILLGSLLALRRRGRYGLLFLDGHADFYQPAADPTGEASSMELGFATGRGPELLTRFERFSPLVRDEDVVLFARRDAASAEKEGSQRVEDTPMHRIELPEMRQLGVGASTAKALRLLTRPELDGFWLHLDCDVLDDAAMPAVDYRTPGGGLTFAELAAVLRAAMATGKLAGMEVTIFNPKLDRDGSLARSLVETLGRGLLA